MVKFKALYQEGLDYQDFLAERSPIIITFENGVKNCWPRRGKYAVRFATRGGRHPTQALEGSKEKTNNNVRNNMVS